MTKFETVGVGFQTSATTIQEAQTSFRYSCRCCCGRGMRIDCDRCAIAAAHDQTIAMLNDLGMMGEAPRKEQHGCSKRNHKRNIRNEDQCKCDGDITPYKPDKR